MKKQLWMTLPTKDVAKSKAFYKALGFDFLKRHENSEDMVCLEVGDNKTLVFFVQEEKFKTYVCRDANDAYKNSEMLFSLDAESKAEVDAFALNVKAAGGSIYSEPQESQGWMYGCGFADLDGHRWCILYMDMEKAPKQA